MTHTERFAEACAEMMLAQDRYHAYAKKIKKTSGKYKSTEETQRLYAEFVAADERARLLLDPYLATQGVTEQDIRDQIGDDAMEARRAR